jgi:hypothetical protein
MLEDVLRLLQALSPPEIDAEVTRLFPGGAGDDAASLRWKAYARRHRVLVDLFATQHAPFARAVRAHFERRERHPQGDAS